MALKSQGLFSSANANVECIVTSCSFSLRLSISHLFSLPLTAPLRQAAKPELYIRSGLMSGFGRFSHIYQDEPADPLPPQPLLLFNLLSQTSDLTINGRLYVEIMGILETQMT